MSTETKKLENKIAVITGASSGIGLATAKLFAQNGARVVITARHENGLRAAAQIIGPKTVAIAADIRKVADLDALYRRVSAELGKIDVLFANAGIGPNRAAVDVTEDFFDDIMATNVKGTYFTVQRAIPHLADGAAVVLTSSGAAHLGFPMTSVYAASKAAVRAMARNLAAELLPRGIRVNALSPGLTETPALSPEGLGVPPEIAAEFAKVAIPMVPMRRLGAAEEIARVALFLASRDSSFITGADVPVDGGLTQL